MLDVVMQVGCLQKVKRKVATQKNKRGGGIKVPIINVQEVQEGFLDFLILDDGTDRLSEMSVWNYQHVVRNIPEEHRSPHLGLFISCFYSTTLKYCNRTIYGLFIILYLIPGCPIAAMYWTSTIVTNSPGFSRL